MGNVIQTYKNKKLIYFAVANLALFQIPQNSLASEIPSPLKQSFSDYLTQTGTPQPEQKDENMSDLFQYDNLPTPFVFPMEDNQYLLDYDEFNENGTSNSILLEEERLKKLNTLKYLEKISREALPIIIDVAEEALTIGIGCAGFIGLSIAGMFVPSIAPIIIAGTVGTGTWFALRFKKEKFFENIPHRISITLQNYDLIPERNPLNDIELRFRKS